MSDQRVSQRDLVQLDTERSVLGSMLAHGNGTCDALLRQVEGRDFTDRRHALILEAITAIKARGDHVDIILVQDELSRSGKLDQAGGIANLAAILAADLGPSSAAFHAQALRRATFFQVMADKLQMIKLIADGRAPQDAASAKDMTDLMGHLITAMDEARGELATIAKSAGRYPFMETAAMLTALPEGTLDEVHEPVIGDLLRRGKLSMLSGPSKAGKSLFALGLALHAANGRDFLGQEFSVSRPLRICYIDAELSRVELSDRIHGMLRQYGIEIPTGAIDILCLMDAAGNRWRQTSLEDIRYDLIQHLKTVKADLFILDCLYALKGAGREENSNDDMAEIMFIANQIAAESGAAGLLIHHAAKGSKADASVTDAHAGAGVITRAITGSIIAMREHERKSPFWSLHWTGRQVKGGKCVIEKHADFAFRLAEGMDADQMSGSRAPRRTPQSMVGMPVSEFVAKFVPAAPTTQERIVRNATDQGMAAGIAKGFLVDAIEDGLVVQTRSATRGKPALFSSDLSVQVEASATDRVIAWLRDHPGATIRQIADEVGVSVGTAAQARSMFNGDVQ